MKILILKTLNLVVQLICTLVEAVAVGISVVCMKVINLCNRVEEQADHAVNETVCKAERKTYTQSDGFVHPDYGEI